MAQQRKLNSEEIAENQKSLEETLTPSSLPSPSPPPSPSLLGCETEEGVSSESWPNLEEVEDKILNYKFKNKTLLEEALTHHSYPTENNLSYERLEYVGDSVLSFLFSQEQFLAYPDLPPGKLTQLRAANVDTEKLARVALKLELYKYLRHKKPQFANQIQEFTKEIKDYPIHSNGLVDAPKALADIVESTIGALFIDCGLSLATVWKVFKSLLEPIITPETLKKHPNAELFEYCQKRGLKIQRVDDWKNNLTYMIIVQGQLLGSAKYHNKKDIAVNRAAKNALIRLKEIIGEDDDNQDNDNGHVVDGRNFEVITTHMNAHEVRDMLSSTSKYNTDGV